MTNFPNDPEQNKYQNRALKKIQDLTKTNQIFLIVIFLFMIAGIKLSSDRGKIAPLVPSLLFGSASSILVYYFLGGIKETNDNSVEANLGLARVKLIGGMATLVGSSMIYNHILSNQMKSLELAIIAPPHQNEHDLLVLNKKGEAVSVTIHGTVGLEKKDLMFDASNVEDNLRTIKEICRSGQGFCKEEYMKTKMEVNENLKPEYARLCTDVQNLNLYPLMISSSKAKEAIHVTASSTKYCNPNTKNNSKNYLLIEISREDAQKIMIKNGEEGYATIPSLKINGLTESIYKKKDHNNPLQKSKC